MEKQVKWISSDTYNLDISKCSIYYKSSMTSRAWESLRASVNAVNPCVNLSSTKKATAIVFVSKSLILVI
jgi:hypothetical protein